MELTEHKHGLYWTLYFSNTVLTGPDDKKVKTQLKNIRNIWNIFIDKLGKK